MNKDDTISEFIGALANMAVKNESGSLQKDEILKILEIAKVENSKGDNYERPRGLVDKAKDYWNEKDRSTVVKNIDDIFSF